VEANTYLNKSGLASGRCRAATLPSLSRSAVVAKGAECVCGGRAAPLLLAGRGGEEDQSCDMLLQRLEVV
jgi:hypothetical protein